MMKDFILNWRASVKRNVLNENKILHEASDEEIEVIEDVLADLDPESLPMNGAFGGKLRKVIPIETIGGKVGGMVSDLESAGYTVNLKDGTVSYETRREHEGKVYKGKKVLKINKLLNGLLAHKKKANVVAMAMADLRTKRYTRGNTEEENEKYTEDYNKKNEEWEKLASIGKKAFKGLDRWMLQKNIEKHIKAWEEDAGYFKNDPEALSGFSIIVSRHPVDVLRMSDFDDITSCHTLASRSGENGSFVKCAYAEALDGGAIAYVVPTEDIKDFESEYGPIEDNTEEVLVDEVRVVGSIDPVSRIRIRVGRMMGGEDNDTIGTIGVPDRRIYGQKISNFYETLKDWLAKSQQDEIKLLPKITPEDVGDFKQSFSGVKIEDEDIGKINAKKIARLGGSYEDNPFELNLAALLTPGAGLRGQDDLLKNDLIVGRSRHGFDEDDISLPRGNTDRLEAELEEETDDWNRRLAHMTIHAEVTDWGDGPAIDTHANLSIDLELSEDDFSDSGWNELRNNGYDYGKYIFDELEGMGYDWAGDETISQPHIVLNRILNNFELRGIIVPSDDMGGYIYDIDSFNDWGSALENRIDDMVDDLILPVTMNVLRREGALITNKVDEFYRMTQDDPDYHESDWTFDYRPDEETVDVDLDDIPIKVDEIEGLEEKYYDQEVIKEIMMSRDFRTLWRKLLFDKVPGFIPGESMYPDLTRGWVGHGGSNYGITFTMDSDDPDEQFDSIKGAIVSIDKELASEIAMIAYAQFAKHDKKYKKQQDLPFEGKKALNERIHRNWSSFLGK